MDVFTLLISISFSLLVCTPLCCHCMYSFTAGTYVPFYVTTVCTLSSTLHVLCTLFFTATVKFDTVHVYGLKETYILCSRMFITCCRKACPGEAARLSSISGPSSSSSCLFCCLAYSLSNSPKELSNPSSFSISMTKLCKIKQVQIHIFALPRSFSVWIRKRMSLSDWNRPLSEP